MMAGLGAKLPAFRHFPQFQTAFFRFVFFLKQTQKFPGLGLVQSQQFRQLRHTERFPRREEQRFQPAHIILLHPVPLLSVPAHARYVKICRSAQRPCSG